MILERAHHVVPGAVGVLFLDLCYQPGDVTEYFLLPVVWGIRTRRIFDLSTAGRIIRFDAMQTSSLLIGAWPTVVAPSSGDQGPRRSMTFASDQFDRVAVGSSTNAMIVVPAFIGPASRSIFPPRARISAAAW